MHPAIKKNRISELKIEIENLLMGKFHNRLLAELQVDLHEEER
jgi:hypothetical protein